MICQLIHFGLVVHGFKGNKFTLILVFRSLIKLFIKITHLAETTSLLLISFFLLLIHNI